MNFPTVNELVHELRKVCKLAEFEEEGVFVKLAIWPERWRLFADPAPRQGEGATVWSCDIVCPSDTIEKLEEIAVRMLQVCEADFDDVSTQRFFG